MNFESLPLEILQQIATCVEIAHRPSLHAFTLTNKACRKVSSFIIFRRIQVTVHDRDRLRHDVDELIEDLSRTDSFRYVHQLTIKGALKLNKKNLEGFDPQTPWSVQTGLDQILDEEKVSWQGMYAVYDEAVIEKSSEEDIAWAPIIDLLRATIHLKDLVYDCQSQFAPSLLTTLHEQRPQCRLHHLTFRFRTLLWSTPKAYEMQLATSPSLYRIKAICSQRDSEGDDNFNQEAIMELVAGLAPNLTEVAIVNILPGRSLRGTRPRDSWKGLPGFTGKSRGSLTALSMVGMSKLREPTMLQNWAEYTNFACLQHLTLGGCNEAWSSALSGETMEWLAQNHTFPEVKTLKVFLTRDDAFQEKPLYDHHAISFFQAFGPLQELSISGPISWKILANVLVHHGQTLQKLSLHICEESLDPPGSRERREIPHEFTCSELRQISNQCPVLEELMIPIKRDRGSASEVNQYKSLGQFRSLRSLFLILDCSNWRVTRDSTYDPKFDGDDDNLLDYPHHPYVQIKHGDVKNTYINSAVDESLARSIFKVIDHTTTGRPLERLKLWTTGAGKYGDSHGLPVTFSGMARHMGRSWLFERAPRGDGKEEIVVKELRQEQRRARDQKELRYWECRHDPQIWTIFQSIWPPKETSRDWRDDWSSFPLATAEFSERL